MSMPMLVSDHEPAAPIAPPPMLRMADDLVVDDDDAEAAAAVRLIDGRVVADDAATLPAACVICGDTVGVVGLVTPRGRIGFSLCREHAISALARAAVGAIVICVAAYVVARGGGGRGSKVLIAAALSCVGATLIATAVPVWTWRGTYGGRRLYGVRRVVREAIRRAGR